MSPNTAAPTVNDIEEWITSRVLSYGEIDEAKVGPEVPLIELGLDSVFALTLCGDIEDAYGIEVDPTIAWDHPTIAALATEIAERLSV